ncbi:MAG: PepSY-associated TM helix domain-containing protein [Novosphingobium meiothermophilum]
MAHSGFLTWHRRIALLFAPLIFLQALTGTILLLREPLAYVLEPQGSDGPVLGVPVLAAAAARTGLRLTRLYPPAYPGGPAMAQLARADGSAHYAAIEPASGVILREGGIWAFPLEAALQWHYRLMSGTVGLAVVALHGVVLLLLSGTGLGFWWPAAGRWKKSLAINPKMPARVRLRQWHRSGGVLASLLVLFSAVTGVLLAAPDLVPAAPIATTAFAASPRQLDAAMGAATRAYPAAAIRDVRFPAADRIDVNFRAPEDGPLAVHAVSVRLSDAKLLRIVPAAQSSALWMKVLPLHTGDISGLAGMLLLLLEALAIIALSITGPMMWWRQRKLRK